MVCGSVTFLSNFLTIVLLFGKLERGRQSAWLLHKTVNFRKKESKLKLILVMLLVLMASLTHYCKRITSDRPIATI